MAARYLAIHVSTGRDRLRLLDLGVPPGLHRVHDTPNLVVFVSDDAEVLPLSGGAGLLIGHLFAGGPMAERICAIDPDLARDIVESNGQRLIDDYWGNYVALLHPGPDDRTVAVRDPSGALPLYWLAIEGATIMASDIETVAAFGFKPKGIDWSFFPQHFLAFDLRTPQTALDGVTELLAGHRLTLSSDRSDAEPVWTPWDHVTPTTLSRQDTAARLRQTVLAGIEALAKVHGPILLGVSGGLDSSVIACGLAQSSSAFRLFTMATADASGDERIHARQLAEALGQPLTEAFYRLDDADVLRPSAAHLPRPLQLAYGQSEVRTRFALAEEFDSQAIFSGIGGDNVFCLMQSASPLADRFLSEPMSPGVWKTLDDLCRLTQCSAWDAISMACRRVLTSRRGYIWQPDPRFLNPDVIQSALPLPLHPWLKAPRGALPGKAAHVAMLARIQGTIDGFSRVGQPPQVLPLLSQPIMELCLAIPTWEWIAAGQNRSVVRDAFAGLLPQAIVSRRSKGGPTGFAFEVIERQRRELRETLLDGLLAGRGLLDTASIDEALNGRRAIHGTEHIRLGLFAEAEAWARHWSGQLLGTKASSAPSRLHREDVALPNERRTGP